MCGIAGVSRTYTTVERESLERMANALAHRGPDDRGMYVDGRVGLMQTRLSIIDHATGRQPMFNADRSLCLVANGEIYNYVELRSELQARGHVFQSQSDCECIIHAFAEYGDAFLEKLHGMFAFALLEMRTGRMLLARDRLGIKPLFIEATGEGVRFASELKALFAETGRTPQVNAQALAQVLQGNFSSGEHTLVLDSTRVLAGEALWIESGRIARRWRYWRLTDVRTRAWGHDEASEYFDDLMAQVMNEHLRADVPIGLFLSGGVDSSVLLALASRATQQPVTCFSVGFAGAKVADELPHARAVAAHLGADLHCLELGRDALLNRLSLAVWSADELMGDYANLPTSALAEFASEDLKVVFTGEGGDEVFAGYGRYRMGAMKRWLNRARGRPLDGFRGRGIFTHKCVQNVFGPELRAAEQQWRSTMLDTWHASPRAWTRLQRMQATDTLTWLPDDLLVKADRMLMAFGVEGRVPLLDHRVVEFGLSLPDDFKCDAKRGKLFLRRWANKLLPAALLERRKQGFTVPVAEWFEGAFLERLTPVLLTSPAIEQWCDPDGVRGLIEHQRQRQNASKGLWSLLQFAIWHKLFVEGNGARPPSDCDPVEFLAN